jgi:1,4-dihydroxy-6-naphthoate synthase
MANMKTLMVGHSPDADDAFMFYGLASGLVKVHGYAVDHVLEDIESLNRRARSEELDVTAISAAAYPSVASLYRIMSCGASVGRRYGPIVLAGGLLLL